jgi:hypothetical protein
MAKPQPPERDLTRLGASRLVARGGALLCQRRGPLTPQDQTVGRYGGRAPEKRGIWAFPFPYNDDFFNWHKWDEVVPKRLTTAAIEAVVLAEEDLPLEKTTTEALWAEREAWLKQHVDIMPLRRFWWQGDVWARLDRQGEVLHAQTAKGSTMGWELMNIDEYMRAARKAEPYGRWTHDHMEIFLAPGRGRVVGREG